jgi:tetratricopeptide (TPR) repeat protein
MTDDIAQDATSPESTPIEPTPEPVSTHAQAEPEAAEATATVEEVVSRSDDEMIPLWLAALVLVLLLSVMGVGGYLVGAVMTGEQEPRTPEEYEVQRLRETVAQNPDDINAVLQLGYAYQQAGMYEEAIAEYDRVLEVTEFDTAALYNKGIVLLELDRGDEAEVVLWDVLEFDDGHVLAAKALGDHYAEKEQYRSLIEAVRPVVEQNESAADLQYLMGLAYENLGRADWAEARYRLALTYYPDMQEAREGLERLGVEP